MNSPFSVVGCRDFKLLRHLQIRPIGTSDVGWLEVNGRQIGRSLPYTLCRNLGGCERARAFYEHFDFVASPTDPMHLFFAERHQIVDEMTASCISRRLCWISSTVAILARLSC